jgi:hypothetical protein
VSEGVAIFFIEFMVDGYFIATTFDHRNYTCATLLMPLLGSYFVHLKKLVLGLGCKW